MTQKELLYYEDAVGHEDSIIKIIDNNIKSLSNEELISFMQQEKEKHMALKENLINILKEAVNG